MTDPQSLAITITTVGGAIVGLVVWLQRHQAAQVREQLAALKEPASNGLSRIIESLAEERSARERLAEQVAGMAVEMARVSTDVRWLRHRLERGLTSDAPRERIGE